MTAVALSPSLLPLADGIEVGNVGALLAHQAARVPDRVMLKCNGEVLTYREVNELANRLARGLAAAGVRGSDRVCVLLPNCTEMVLIWMALAKLGAVWVPINSEYRGERLVRMLESTQSRLMIVHEELRASLAGSLEGMGRLGRLVWVGEPVEVRAPRALRGDRLEDLIHDDDRDVFEPVGPNAPLMFLFTSGSTGWAKPVVISHGFALHTAGELIAHVGYGPDDIMFTPFPLFHGDATMLSVLPALIAGTTVAVSRRFSASGFLSEVREHGATVMTAMGTVISYLLSRPKHPDDAENPLRAAIAGAVPATVPEFERRFGLRVIEIYGSTECCLVAFNTGLPHEVGMGGQVCPHHEVQIVDAHENILPNGEVGQIVVRGRVAHAHMSGYHGDAEATVLAWQGLRYHTGDLGSLDDRGTLRFAGRVKDVIRRRGENIPAAEVEEAFDRHPAVLMAAAIAVPSDIVEDDMKVIVELVDGSRVSHEELIAFVRDRLPSHMVPRYLETVTTLPRTVTGKTNKAALRENWDTPGTSDFDPRAAADVTPL